MSLLDRLRSFGTAEEFADYLRKNGTPEGYLAYARRDAREAADLIEALADTRKEAALAFIASRYATFRSGQKDTETAALLADLIRRIEALEGRAPARDGEP